MTRAPAGAAVVARRTAVPAAAPDEFTYAVLTDAAVLCPEPGASRPGKERRSGTRQRKRLCSGKLVDADGRFLVECLIANRSARGGMLRLPGRGGLAVPGRIMLFDDRSGELLPAAVIWRRDREVGIRFTPSDRSERHRTIADAMRRKFYAMSR